MASPWNRPFNTMAEKGRAARNDTVPVRAPKPQGRGIVKALGQKGTTGNFAKIAAAKGKGAAVAALQNKLAKHRGQPAPFAGRRAERVKAQSKPARNDKVRNIVWGS